MTTTEFACALLVAHGPLSASMLGAMLWPERTTRVSAVQGGGDYAAQMLLGRMRRAGLVRVARGEGSSRWEVTTSGRALAIKAGGK